jgi:hypothetical protein
VHGSTGIREVAFNITFLEPNVAMCPSLFHPKLLSSLNLHLIFIKCIYDALSMHISSFVDTNFLFV